jgi:hypothetical protein
MEDIYKVLAFKLGPKGSVICLQVASCATGNGGKHDYILCFTVCCFGKGHHEPRSCGSECQLCITGT